MDPSPETLRGRLRVVLHIGMMKTGSTALQSSLAKNRELLAEAGILYPEGHCQIGDKHTDLVWGSLGQERLTDNVRTRYSGASPAEAVRNIKAECLQKKCSIIVLSAEDFSRHPAHTYSELLGLLGELTVVVFLRDQRYAVPSMHAQLVKHGGLDISIPQYVDRILENHAEGVWHAGEPTFDYWKLLSGWREVVGFASLRVGIHEESTSDVVARFLDLSDLQGVIHERLGPERLLLEESRLGRRNPSLAGPFLDVAIAVNRCVTDANTTPVMEALQRAQRQAGWQHHNTLDDELAARVAGAFSETNSKVAHTYFSRHALFSRSREQHGWNHRSSTHSDGDCTS